MPLLIVCDQFLNRCFTLSVTLCQKPFQVAFSKIILKPKNNNLMKLLKLSLVGGSIALAVVVFFACKKNADDPSVISAAKVTKITTPVITCGTATQASIEIQVCAPQGGTGLPAGFSIQWMTKTAFAANGNQWYASEDERLCKASFSGNANLSRYNLAAGQCVTVKVGEFLFDEGASTNCGDELKCDSEYVFRAFGHATNTLNRSDFTNPLLSCATRPCGSNGICTYTQGYWKNHNPNICTTYPTSPLCIQWPASSVTLGTVSYNVTQLLSIFNKPAAGNGLIALAHQLIAAKLNIAKGADATAVAQAIIDADNLIGGSVIPPVGNGYLAPAATSALVTALTNYNEGATGPGHCQ